MFLQPYNGVSKNQEETQKNHAPPNSFAHKTFMKYNKYQSIGRASHISGRQGFVLRSGKNTAPARL